jgi:phosphoglucomutase
MLTLTYKNKVIATKPFLNQKPGTSGLRFKTKVFMQDNFVENYIQSIYNALSVKNKSISIGSDGRFYTPKTLQIALSMAIANNANTVYIAQNGVISTPAVSNFIRLNKLNFAITATASHNPAGIDNDFGIKVNNSFGSPLEDSLNNKIFENTNNIDQYNILENFNLDINKLGKYKINNTTVIVFDPVVDYVEMLENIFNFNAIKKLLHSGFKFKFNGFCGTTGMYAKEIFVNKFQLDIGCLKNYVSKEDFGGLIPDPNPTTALDFVNEVRNENLDLGFCCDSDGDRNFIFSKKHFLEPSDQIALFLEHIDTVLIYKNNLFGVARSFATSKALDFVAKEKNVDLYITPVGWKFFGNLLEANKITLCGEESFGVGSNHIREKDGLWAVLFILHIIATTNLTLDNILENLWSKYGRFYFNRLDYENLSSMDAENILNKINKNAPTFENLDYKLTKIEQFNYTDPTTNIKTENAGLSIEFLCKKTNHNATLVIRKSGTGTQNTTLRLYITKYQNTNILQNKEQVLANLIKSIKQLMDTNINPSFIV